MPGRHADGHPGRRFAHATHGDPLHVSALITLRRGREGADGSLALPAGWFSESPAGNDQCQNPDMAKRKLPKPLLAPFLLLHLIAVTVTWRDIQRRPSKGVRGPKWLWRLATGLNTGAATVAYVAVGRRGSTQHLT